MSKHFCCCIPVRFGVFVFSLVSLLGSGFLALVCWASLAEMVGGKTINNMNFGNASKGQRIATGVAGGIFSLIAFVSFLGFLGAIFRKYALVKLYSASTWFFVLAASIASGFFYYFAYSGQELFDGCEVKDQQGLEHDCRIILKTWQKIVCTIVTVVVLLVFVYIASVIGRYVDQLHQEHDEYRLAQPSKGSSYQPTYYPPQVQETHQGLLNTSAAYPYTDQSHSYGHRNA